MNYDLSRHRDMLRRYIDSVNHLFERTELTHVGNNQDETAPLLREKATTYLISLMMTFKREKTEEHWENEHEWRILALQSQNEGHRHEIILPQKLRMVDAISNYPSARLNSLRKWS
ncbi:MAG TPA: hypothetical protein VHZ07_15385 [Bryobacteraceae bacterium]|jgi:hypothetical protein|nr:hypothetical protein [Bryobacteraceae bacterium]